MTDSRRGDAAGRPPIWREALLIAVVYGTYSIVRNQFGSAAVEPEVALRNAERVIDLERSLGLYFEPDVQSTFIDWTAFIQFWNLYYGLFHFLVTYVVLGFTWWARPEVHRFWRRTGLWTTVLAVIGYATFPLMPPRLLGDCGTYGGCQPESPYVDTVVDVGGIWSFESSGMEAISNQYAAMPSLHIGWALWSALVLSRVLRAPWARRIAWLHPLFTLFAIVVTANHYWIDGVGGALVLLGGLGISHLWQARFASPMSHRRHRRGASAHNPSDDTVGGGVA